MLWNVLKLEYIFFASGLALIFVVLYESFSLPVQALKVLQTIGLILYVIAVARISVFFISKQSNEFLEDSMKKWMGKSK